MSKKKNPYKRTNNDPQNIHIKLKIVSELTVSEYVTDEHGYIVFVVVIILSFLTRS